MSDGPWTFAEARQICHTAAQRQAEVEGLLQQAFRDFAVAEEDYRKALAIKIVELHDEGVAWSVAPDLARGDERVAELRRVRDVAEGIKDSCQQLAWRRAADRKDAQRFADWSQRRELAEFHGHDDPDASLRAA